MNPFPGPRSVVVMDNCRVHHNGRIGSIFEAQDILHMYLPPYSPDFNPIEKAFSVLKNQLKRARVLTGNNQDPTIIKSFFSDVVTPELMQALFRDCGYL